MAGLLTAACGGPAHSTSARGVVTNTTDPTEVLVGLRVAPEGPRTGYQRKLANDWITVKKAWDHLTADQNEADDLRVMLRTCDR